MLKVRAHELTEDQEFSDSNSGGGDCTFCSIVNGEALDTEILHSDDDAVCFRDVHPGAPYHFLVVSKRHITNCLSLRSRDAPLVKKMAEIGRAVLHANNVTDMNEARLGFHVPPATSVPHLHLHVLAPVSELYLKSEFKFREDTWRFISVERFLQTLKE